MAVAIAAVAAVPDMPLNAMVLETFLATPCAQGGIFGLPLLSTN